MLAKAELYDQEKDHALQGAYELFGAFIQPHHLELSEDLCQDSDIQVAITRTSHPELSLINSYQTPHDKLVSISNCYRVLHSTLHPEIILTSHMDSAADLTLPLLIYILLKAKIPGLYRNYYYIKHFRYRERRQVRDPEEFRYIFTTLKIALNFITELKPERLNLKPGEYLSRPETVNVGVQTEDRVVEIRFGYNGELNGKYLTGNLEEMKAMLEDFGSLREKYRQKSGRLVVI